MRALIFLHHPELAIPTLLAHTVVVCIYYLVSYGAIVFALKAKIDFASSVVHKNDKNDIRRLQKESTHFLAPGISGTEVLSSSHCNLCVPIEAQHSLTPMNI